MTHICVGKLTNIDLDNGLSPERRQAIIWTSVGILLIGPLGTNFSENLFVILTFSFTKMRLKVSSAKWRPFCLGLNVLNKLFTHLMSSVNVVIVFPAFKKRIWLLYLWTVLPCLEHCQSLYLCTCHTTHMSCQYCTQQPKRRNIRFLGALQHCNVNCVHLKARDSFHGANFVVTEGTRGCNENLRCHQWRQKW